tara:strand:- start:653 stop:1147 length:495 start_codon:yes stop_codon:yes gene_type:complete
MTTLNNLVENDIYYTKKETWENILHYLPRDKIYLDPFFGDGSNIENLKEIGINCIGYDIDYFNAIMDLQYDIILTNSPFSKNILIEFLYNLSAIDKPFIIILPITKIFSKYFKNAFYQYRSIQIIIPKSRMSFIIPNSNNKSNPSFVCCYVAYKMDLPADILFL